MFNPLVTIDRDPREESFFDMFYRSLCPKFKFKSATFLIAALVTQLLIKITRLHPFTLWA